MKPVYRSLVQLHIEPVRRFWNMLNAQCTRGNAAAAVAAVANAAARSTARSDSFLVLRKYEDNLFLVERRKA